MRAEHEPGDFALGELVTDGVWIAKVVVDIDAGTALDPFKIDEWSYLDRGALVETHEAGLVHFAERPDLRRA